MGSSEVGSKGFFTFAESSGFCIRAAFVFFSVQGLFPVMPPERIFARRLNKMNEFKELQIFINFPAK